MSAQGSDLLLVIAVVAIGFLLAVFYYESLCDRDVYVRRPMRLARRVSRHRPVILLTYVVALVVGIPIMVGLWALLLTLALFIVGSVDRTTSTAFVAVAVIGAARVLAYARQKTSHELAKAVPLSMVFLLITGGSLNLTEKFAVIEQTVAGVNVTSEMLAILIGIEATLRVTTDALNTLLDAVRRRRGIQVEGGAGVWRSLWAALRQPKTPITAAVVETTPAD